MTLQIAAIVTRTIETVGDNGFRIIAVTIFVGLHLPLKITAFVTCIPVQFVDMRQLVAGQADADFCTKFHRLAKLSSDNGSQMGLADADNAIVAASGVGFVHFILLIIEMG